MGTRGLWGFVVDGEEKLTYNHFDSYPEGLGLDLLKFLHEAARTKEDRAKLRTQAVALRVVDDDTPPTSEDIERLAKFHDGGVSTGELTEWYSLLRETQGDPTSTLEAGVMIDSRDFALDSLFCEWAYVIDLDEGTFEAYRGFQKEPHTWGRFADRGKEREAYGGATYYPIRRIGCWSLDNLPTAAEIEAIVEGMESDEVPSL